MRACYLTCKGIIFIPPDNAHQPLTAPPVDIVAVSQVLLPALSGQNLAFNKALDWLHFYFMHDRSIAFVDPAATDLT